jgi:DNA-repair protein XRCC3
MIITRLKEISKNFIKDEKYTDFTNGIHHKHIFSSEGFQYTIFNEISILIGKYKNIRLLIIDSIGSIFRTEFEDNDYIKRSELLFKISIHLKKLAVKYNLVVVIVNQVSSVIEEEYKSYDEFDYTVSTMDVQIKKNHLKKLTPTLGLSWSNCIDSRLYLSKSDYSKKRKLNIIYSPYVEQISCEFEIIDNGVKGIEE